MLREVGPVSEETAQRLYAEAQASGRLPAQAAKVVRDGNGGVRAIDAKGRTARWLRRPSLDKLGRAVSREAARAGGAMRPGSLEENAVPRVVRIAKSWFGNLRGGASQNRIRSLWEGYKRAHPEARGNIVVDGDRVLLRHEGGTLTSTLLSRPRRWRQSKPEVLKTHRA